MELIIDNKTIRKTLGQDDPYAIITSIYGPSLTSNLTSFIIEQQKSKLNLSYFLINILEIINVILMFLLIIAIFKTIY